MDSALDTSAALLKAVESEANLGGERRIVNRILNVAAEGGVVYLFGNGGSASQAGHFAAELMVKFERLRAPIMAVDLSSQPAALTAACNDLGYDQWPLRAVRAMQARDLFIALTTSAKSPNVVTAVEAAFEATNGPRTAGIYGGKFPGAFKNQKLITTDQHARIVIPSTVVSTIQEATLHFIHRICAAVEAQLPGAS